MKVGSVYCSSLHNDPESNCKQYYTEEKERVDKYTDEDVLFRVYMQVWLFWLRMW